MTSRNFNMVHGNEGLDPTPSASCKNTSVDLDQPSVSFDVVSRAESSQSTHNILEQHWGGYLWPPHSASEKK
jgi:hypothetical protein